MAIESSCDDTAAAVLLDGHLFSNVIASQVDHARLGGVVPELASRAHLQYIVPVVEEALATAGVTKQQIDAIAVTIGPGLLGSLIVGVSFAKGLALGLNVPLIGVHHLQAHVLGQFLQKPAPEFPFLCLLVSGGHTQIILVKSPLDMEVIGQTLDDAAGEAFDKAGKLMGLGYPAGPEIDKIAQTGTARYALPHPQLAGFDFSFSGFKTAIRNFLRDGISENNEFIDQNKADICASIQHHIVAILLETLHKAVRATSIKRISVAGGVSANSALRRALIKMGTKHGWEIYLPPQGISTDNAGMVAMAAWFKMQYEAYDDLSIKPMARIPNINI